MRLFEREDERAKVERYKINVIVLVISALIAVISVIIKSFFLDYNFFTYGAEAITLGGAALFGIVVLVSLLRNKQLDERLKIALSKVGTLLIVAVYLGYFGLIVALLLTFLTQETLPVFSSSYTFLPFVLISSIVGLTYRAFATSAISRNAFVMGYKQYKKRIVKVTAIAVACLLAVSIGLAITSEHFKSVPMLTISLNILFFCIPASIAVCLIMLRTKKRYDKEIK